jgi:hypothetical protein
LLSESETNSFLTDIEFGVPVLDEDVTHDQGWSEAWWEFNGLETNQTLGLTELSNFQNVLGSWNVVGLSVNGQIEVSKGVSLTAIDDLGSSDLVKDWLDNSLRSDHQRSTSIDDTVEVSWSDGFRSETLAINSDQPVVLTLELVVGEVSSVVGWVGSSENELGSLSVWLVGQEEGETWGINLLLLDSQIENGWEVIDRNLLPSHTQNTVELSWSKVETQVGHFTETDTGNSNTTPKNTIESDLTVDISRTVLDLHVSVLWIILVGRTLGGVVLVLSKTSQLLTVMGWNPEIGRTGIEDNGEALWSSTDGNWSVVLSILNIGDWDIVSSSEVLDVVSGGSGESQELLQGHLWLFDFNFSEGESASSEQE